MIMSAERKVILLELITLAKKRRYAAGEQEIMTLSATAMEEFIDSEEYKEERQQSRAIYDCMMQMSFEDVKFVQTVMYMGRDESLDEAGDAESLYHEVYASLRWNTQEIEAKMIAEKMPLDEYLSRGMEMMAVIS